MVRHRDEHGVFAYGIADPPQAAIEHYVKLADAVLQNLVIYIRRMLAIHEVPKHMAALIDGPKIDEEKVLVLMLQQIIQRARPLLIGEDHLIPELARRQHSVIERLRVFR